MKKSTTVSGQETPAPNTVELAPGIAKVSYGSGITRRSRLSYQLDTPGFDFNVLLQHLAEWASPSPGKNSFDGRIEPIEAAAERILEAAGYPSDPRARFKFTRDGYEWEGTAISALRDQERISAEWYSAEILNNLRVVRRAIEDGDAALAAGLALELGALWQEGRDKLSFEESVLKFERVRRGPKKNKGRERRNRFVMAFVQSKLKTDPKITSDSLWAAIPKDEMDAVAVGGAKLFRTDCKLFVSEKIGKDRKITANISRATFPSYLTEAKKRVSSKSLPARKK